MIKCKKCGTTLPEDTGKQLIYCKCKKVAVDGCKYYTRVIGDFNDYEVVGTKGE